MDYTICNYCSQPGHTYPQCQTRTRIEMEHQDCYQRPHRRSSRRHQQSYQNYPHRHQHIYDNNVDRPQQTYHYHPRIQHRYIRNRPAQNNYTTYERIHNNRYYSHKPHDQQSHNNYSHDQETPYNSHPYETTYNSYPYATNKRHQTDYYYDTNITPQNYYASQTNNPTHTTLYNNYKIHENINNSHLTNYNTTKNLYTTTHNYSHNTQGQTPQNNYQQHPDYSQHQPINNYLKQKNYSKCQPSDEKPHQINYSQYKKQINYSSGPNLNQQLPKTNFRPQIKQTLTKPPDEALHTTLRNIRINIVYPGQEALIFDTEQENSNGSNQNTQLPLKLHTIPNTIQTQAAPIPALNLTHAATIPASIKTQIAVSSTAQKQNSFQFNANLAYKIHYSTQNTNPNSYNFGEILHQTDVEKFFPVSCVSHVPSRFEGNYSDIGDIETHKTHFTQQEIFKPNTHKHILLTKEDNNTDNMVQTEKTNEQTTRIQNLKPISKTYTKFLKNTILYLYTLLSHHVHNYNNKYTKSIDVQQYKLLQTASDETTRPTNEITHKPVTNYFERGKQNYYERNKQDYTKTPNYIRNHRTHPNQLSHFSQKPQSRY